MRQIQTTAFSRIRRADAEPGDRLQLTEKFGFDHLPLETTVSAVAKTGISLLLVVL
jgi:hypothetical protein